MTRSPRAPRSRRLLLLPLLLAAMAPYAAVAQVPVPVEVQPQHPTRFLLVGQLARFSGETEATAGFLYQLSLRSTRVETLPGGGRIERAPRIYLHTLATAGLGTGEDRLRATGQLGLVRRNDHRLLTAAGLAAQGVLTPRAVGPVVRGELMDNVALQAGWLFPDEGRGRVWISVDYMRDILTDLGLRR